jgi:hypothetical protein
MKTTLKTWAGALALAVTVCLSFLWGTACAVGAVAIAVYRVARDLVQWRLDRVTKPEVSGNPMRPQVRLVQAMAFVQRLAKRERPHVTPDWRMCPST